jgi:hypothetical protein
LIARVDDVELTVDGGGTVLGASQMVSGETYTIYAVGTTDFTIFGADSNTVGHTFYASGAGTGTGQVQVAGDTARIALVASGTVLDVVEGKVKVSDITSDITVLQGSVSTKASSSDLDDLDGRVTTAESEISAIDGASISQNLLDIRGIGNEQEAAAILSLRDVLGRYFDRDYLIGDIAKARTSLQADVNDQGVAFATAKTELAALIDANSALISSEQTARADADSAIASDVTSLTTTVGDNTASITAASSSIDGIEAKYGVEIDINGSISGFQLLSGAGLPSAFNVRADQFNLFNSSGIYGGTPFSVFTSSRTIDGVTYPAGTYMDDIYVQNSINVTDQSGNIIFGAGTPLGGTFIADAAIDTANIKDASVGTLKIANASVTQEGVAGSSGVTNNSSTWTTVASFGFNNLQDSANVQGTISFLLTTAPSNLPTNFGIQVLVNGAIVSNLNINSAGFISDNNRFNIRAFSALNVPSGTRYVTFRMQNMGGYGVNFSNLSATAAMR